MASRQHRLVYSHSWTRVHTIMQELERRSSFFLDAAPIPFGSGHSRGGSLSVADLLRDKVGVG